MKSIIILLILFFSGCYPHYEIPIEEKINLCELYSEYDLVMSRVGVNGSEEEVSLNGSWYKLSDVKKDCLNQKP